MRVDDCMSPDVVTVAASAMLDRAAQTMVERRVGSAIIMDDDKVVGIVTERDVLRAVARGLVPWSTAVADCMTAEPHSIEPSARADEALATMLENDFRHLPVVGPEGLVGIVSLRDLAGRVQEPSRDETSAPTKA